MGSTGFLLLMLTFISASAGQASFVQLKCQVNTVGLYDQRTMLNCLIDFTDDVSHPTIQILTWKNGDETKLYYNEGELEVSPGYAFAVPRWNKTTLNVSLLIQKTSLEHDGGYECYVNTNKGSAKSHISLEVIAKYSTPTFNAEPKNLNRNKEGTVTCQTKDGYPKGKLRWFDEDDKEWIQNPETEFKQTESGLFILSSTMPVLPGSPHSKYTCKVFNAKGEKENESTFEVKDEPSHEGSKQDPDGTLEKSTDTATKVVAPVVVIGSLIVGLLIVLVYRRRSTRDHVAVPVSEPEGVTV